MDTRRQRLPLGDAPKQRGQLRTLLVVERGGCGIVGLTKVAALEYASRGVRVNVVAPGPILTGQLVRAGEAAQQDSAQAVPMRRVGQPEEVASTVAWLSGDGASFITGAVVPIDSGKLAGMAPFAGKA